MASSCPANSPPSDRPHLRRLAWHIDTKKVWRSFILQEIDISAPSAATASDPAPISILVLDSSQYGSQPSLDHGFESAFLSILTFGFLDVQVAGLHGNILQSQDDAITEFEQHMKAEGRRWILASHHPYAALGRATYPRFNRARDAGGIPVTLSAHTHFGEILWHRDTDREGDWLEINVGSILDSPVEFRDLQLFRLGSRIAIRSHRRLMEDELRRRGLLVDDLPGYRPSYGDPDSYLVYQDLDRQGFLGSAVDSDFSVKRILLATYLRMLRLFTADSPDQSSTIWPRGPDGTQLSSHDDVAEAEARMLSGVSIADVDALTRFLYELEDFQRTQRYSGAMSKRLRAYRLSQAMWASRAELNTRDRRNPEIDPEMSFFILPEPLAEPPAQLARRSRER